MSQYNTSTSSSYYQYMYAKKVKPKSTGLVDLAVKLVDSVLHLTYGQVKFLRKTCEEIQVASPVKDEI